MIISYLNRSVKNNQETYKCPCLYIYIYIYTRTCTHGHTQRCTYARIYRYCILRKTYCFINAWNIG